MSQLNNEIQDENLQAKLSLPELETQERIPSRICTPAKQGAWAWLKTFLKALRSRKKQISAQRPRKSAQDWRDETQAKKPFWGGGF